MDILVISHSCLRAINRKVYNRLNSENNLSIGIVVPEFWISNGKTYSYEEVIADENETFKIIPLSISSNNPRTYYFKELSTIISKFQPKLVYLDNDPLSILSLMLIVLKYKYKFKLVGFSLENVISNVRFSFRENGLFGGIIKLCKGLGLRVSIKFYDHIFLLNSDSVKLFKYLGSKFYSKIPLGFDKSIFRFNSQERLDVRKLLDVDGVVFTYIGRLSEIKGVEYLLISLANMQDLEWTLLLDKFDSRSSYERKIQDLITELGLNSRIRFYSSSHQEIVKYINASDAVILPSITLKNAKEQYGRVIQEVQACKRLMVVSDSGALVEILAGGGVSFKEKNIKELEKILRGVCKDLSKFNEVINYGFENALAYKTIEHQAKLMHNVFCKFI